MTARPVVLVLRALGLGDFLTGLPAIRRLRQALPDHETVLAAPAVLAPLVASVPEIDRLFPRGELQPLDGFDGPVDVAVDLHGNGPASRTLLTTVRPTRTVGFAFPGVDMPGSVWRPDEHEVDRWCRLITESFRLDGPAPGVAGTLGRPAAAVPSGVTIVHPGAASGSRRWPAPRFAAVARALRADGHRVVITGGAAERELATGIAADAGVMPMLDLSLVQLAALVAGARLVVCGDTGIAHLASAYRTPSVLLFGPVSPRNWGPPPGPHRVLWHGNGTGDPHAATTDPALRRITVNEVLGTVADLESTRVKEVSRCGI